MEQLKKNRTTAKRLFTRSSTAVQNSVKLKDSVELVAKKFADLEKRYNDVQEKHELYLVELEEDSDFDATEQNTWMDETQAVFEETERQSHAYIKNCKEIKEFQSNESVEKDTKSIKSKIFTENESYDNLRQFEKTELQNEVKKIENCPFKQ